MPASSAKAGASGFLLEDTPPARIVEAVRQVAAGEPILSPRITRRLMDRVAVQARAYARAKATLAALSPCDTMSSSRSPSRTS